MNIVVVEGLCHCVDITVVKGDKGIGRVRCIGDLDAIRLLFLGL